jgi:divalent metal cation (Fe/Co/Zn/Cd) transporter
MTEPARTLPLVPAADNCDCTDSCCATSPVPGDQTWRNAAGRARALAWFSLAWMTAEGVLGLIGGFRSSSLSLVGWALGSVIEGLASIVVIWRFSGVRELSDTAEGRAQRAVAISFFLLAPYLAIQASIDLVDGHESRLSPLGIAVTSASLLVMPVLGAAKQRLGTQLGSAATSGEGRQNLMCASQAAAVLISLIVSAALGVTIIDPIVALLLAAWAIYEGSRAWRGIDCC